MFPLYCRGIVGWMRITQLWTILDHSSDFCSYNRLHPCCSQAEWPQAEPSDTQQDQNTFVTSVYKHIINVASETFTKCSRSSNIKKVLFSPPTQLATPQIHTTSPHPSNSINLGCLRNWPSNTRYRRPQTHFGPIGSSPYIRNTKPQVWNPTTAAAWSSSSSRHKPRRPAKRRCSLGSSTAKTQSPTEAACVGSGKTRSQVQETWAGSWGVWRLGDWRRLGGWCVLMIFFLGCGRL